MFISEVIHTALVILGSLAERKNSLGVSSKQIAQENNIPQATIEKVVIKLVDMGFVLIRDKPGVGATTGSELHFYLAIHPDEIYVADVIKYFNKGEFKGWYIDENGEELPQSRLSSCINHLRCRGEQFIDKQLKGMSINVLATWSALKNKS